MAAGQRYSVPMSTITAILLCFAIVLVVLAPIGAAYWKPATRLPIALIYGILLSGLAAYHTGLSFARVRAPQPTITGTEVPLAASGEVKSRCAEALDMAEKNSMIRDRSNLERVVVSRTLWNQVPSFVREALVRCLEISRAPAQSGVKVEIVEE